MKSYKHILVLFFATLAVINTAFSQIGTGFFNGDVFNTFTDASTITTGSLAGNNFTVSYANGGGTAGAYINPSQQQYTPGNMPANSGFPSSLPRLLELRGVSGAHSSPFPTSTWTFTSNLQQFATLYIQDVDMVSGVAESIKVEFLDAGGTAINTSNIISKTSSTSGLPTITKNTTDYTITGTAAATEPLIGLTIISTNVRTVRVTELNMGSTGTYELFFGIQSTDHGDAPSGYGDAQHFISTNLGLGSIMPDAEASAVNSSNADGDNQVSGSTVINDEDALSTFSVLTSTTTSYSVNVSVSNSTHANATLFGWIDFNRNGVFDAGERSASVTVADGATSATVNWTGLSGLIAGKTYARFRIAANSTEVQNPTGAAFTGEVEDYTLNITSVVLPLTFLDFSAKRNGDDILVNWKTASETGVSHFELEYSTDGISFMKGGTVGANNGIENDYQFKLNNFIAPVYYIRIKSIDIDGAVKYSSVVTVKKAGTSLKTITIFPNPVTDKVIIILEANVAVACNITITNTAGSEIAQTKIDLSKGSNKVNIPVLSDAPNGIYLIRAVLGNEQLSGKIILAR